MKQTLIASVVLLFAVGAIAVWVYYPDTASQPTDPSLARIKQRGVLVLGSDIPYGVMEFFDASGTPQGIDIDIVRAIADNLGVQLEIKDISWDTLFTSLENNEIDLVASSVTITPERAATMLFSIPYFNGGQSILVRDNETTVRSIEDLRDKAIGTQIDTTGTELAKKYSSRITTFDTIDSEIGAENEGLVYELANGQLDAAIIDYIAAITIVKKNPTLRIVGTPVTQEYYGLAANKSSASLIAAIDAQLRKMKNSGELKTIVDRWVGR